MSRPELRQPIWPRLLPTPMVLAMARVGPFGRMRKAPGTWGSVAGLLYFTIFFWQMNTWENLLFSAVGLYFAVAFCGEAEFRLGRRDPGEVVLDEFVAMPLCFLGWQAFHDLSLPAWSMPWVVFLAGFALFRLFDILKPFGISKLQDLPAGWGVAVDDTAAALAACGTMHVVRLVWLHGHDWLHALGAR